MDPLTFLGPPPCPCIVNPSTYLFVAFDQMFKFIHFQGNFRLPEMFRGVFIRHQTKIGGRPIRVVGIEMERNRRNS